MGRGFGQRGAATADGSKERIKRVGNGRFGELVATCRVTTGGGVAGADGTRSKWLGLRPATARREKVSISERMRLVARWMRVMGGI